MTRRMIDSSMWSNEHFAELPAMARLLLVGIINHADDQGRVKAHPIYLRSQIFPYDDVTADQINGWLELIQQNGTIVLYEVDGKRYAQLFNWWEYQSLLFAMPSDYPAPPDWQDCLRFNSKGGVILTHNWHKNDGSIVPDTCDCYGKPLSAAKKPQAPRDSDPDSDLTNPEPIHVDTHVTTHVNGHVGTQIKNKINQDQDQTKREDRVRATTPQPIYKTPPPMPSPRHRSEKRFADTFMAEAGQLGIGAEPFRRMANLLLDATGKLALADAEPGDTYLNEAKQTTLTLARMGYTTIEDTQRVIDSFKQNDWRGATTPSYRQLEEHASAMLAGKHITVRPQDNGKKEFTSFRDYNEWAARHDPQYRRIQTDGVIIKGTLIKRSNYQPQAAAH